MGSGMASTAPSCLAILLNLIRYKRLLFPPLLVPRNRGWDMVSSEAIQGAPRSNLEARELMPVVNANAHQWGAGGLKELDPSPFLPLMYRGRKFSKADLEMCLAKQPIGSFHEVITTLVKHHLDFAWLSTPLFLSPVLAAWDCSSQQSFNT